MASSQAALARVILAPAWQRSLLSALQKSVFLQVLQAWAEPCGLFSIYTRPLHISGLVRNLELFSAENTNSCSHSEGSCLLPLGQQTACASLCFEWQEADRGMCTWKAVDRWRSFTSQLVAQGLSPLLVTDGCVLHNLYWGGLCVENSSSPVPHKSKIWNCFSYFPFFCPVFCISSSLRNQNVWKSIQTFCCHEIT